jgi:hypothetical protein
MEFMALANHRKTIRKELAEFADEFRRIELRALSSHLEAYGLASDDVPPEAVLVGIAALSRTVVMEEALGMNVGLAETRALVERVLERYEGPAATDDRRSS